MFAFDVESTGLDLWHKCTPFAYTAAFDDGTVHYQEWDVDPLTRSVAIKSADSDKLGQILDTDEMVCHNAQFDMRCADIIISHPDYPYEHPWNWEAIHDTMLASHALRNLWPHGLKLLRSVFLKSGTVGVDVLQQATNHARRICRNKKFVEAHGKWRIADEGDPHWPAMKKPKSTDDDSGWWYFDMWLPGTIARLAPEFLPPEQQYDQLLRHPDYPGYFLHPWENLLWWYNMEDALTTLVLWDVLRDALEEEGLYEQYLERKELLRVAYQTESHGVHLLPRIHDEKNRYLKEGRRHRTAAEDLMRGYDYNEPNINSTQQLSGFLYNAMWLPVIKTTEKGRPSTDAETLEKLQDYVHGHWGENFISDVLLARRNEKAADYLDSYLKWSTRDGTIKDIYWSEQAGEGSGGTRDGKTVPRHQPLPASGNAKKDRNRLRRWQRHYIHPSIWITGTKFTRQSTSNPNIQNVGTGKEDVTTGELDYRLRYSFGPPPNHYWLAIDYSNIELRIWAYLTGNEEFIETFEQGGNIHLLIAKELHPQLRDYDSNDDIPPDLYPLYKTTKNGNFSIIYGSTPGTADATYKIRGAYDRIAARFPEVRTFTKQLHREVNQRGYIETLTGYRLWIPLEDPHKAVSGKVQGTAGSVIGQAMVRCADYLARAGVNGHLIIQVHDELVFQFHDSVPVADPDNELDGLVFNLEREMSSIGNEIDVPLAVSTELITDNWAEGQAL